MVGRMDIARCCCCDVIKPDFPYEEIAGTWSAGTQPNGRQTSSNDAKILFDATLDPSIPWRAKVTVKATCSTTTATWAVRLIGGNEDPGTGYLDGDGVYLRFGFDAGGEFFDLHGATMPADTSTCSSGSGWPGTSPGSSRSITETLQLCWDGVELTAKWGSITVGKFLQAPLGTEPIGDRFGFATETLGAGTTSIEFYDFHVYYVPDADGGRAACEDCPTNHCCQGPVPDELVLEVSFQSENITMVTDPTRCRGNCTNLDGTYYLSIGDCQGSLTCQWDQGANTESAPCDPLFPGFPGGSQSWLWYISATMTTVGGDRAIVFTFYSTSTNPGTMVRLYALLDTPCIDWTDWIDLTKLDGPCDLALYGNARFKVA